MLFPETVKFKRNDLNDENSCLTGSFCRHAKTEREREEITMSTVPLRKKIMTDKIRLLKRTQWSLIDSLGKEENELH